jgi:DNA integrity scanning protein DisA with diadenylate cyclase activity/mannitol/fructose-specific phosphotransferase system IIA component (Ntr-type)
MKKFDRLLSRSSVVLLKSETKDEAFEELVSVMCGNDPELDRRLVLDEIRRREKLLTTQVAPGIAIPHAELPIGKTVIAVGKSEAGIQYSLTGESPVHLIVMIVGERNEHLRVLSEVARRLSDETVYERILEVRDEGDVYDALVNPAVQPEAAAKKDRLSAAMCRHALKLADELGAKAVIVHGDAALGAAPMKELLERDDVFIVTEDETRFPKPDFPRAKVVQVPFRTLNRSNQVEVSLLFVLSRGFLNKGDSVVSLSGIPGSGLLDSIAVIDVEKEFRLLFTLRDRNRPEDLDQEVFARVIRIAGELAEEGREGKPVGTIFVLGDTDNVLKNCQQMVVNPFKGYREDERNILDPSLEETIKEFAKIDGAFIVRGDGAIATAGVYIGTESLNEDLPPGLGARHAAAASITAATGAVSVALSESTRRVSVFKSGERFMVF